MVWVVKNQHLKVVKTQVFRVWQYAPVVSRTSKYVQQKGQLCPEPTFFWFSLVKSKTSKRENTCIWLHLEDLESTSAAKILTE